jgi:hypothetical protein
VDLEWEVGFVGEAGRFGADEIDSSRKQIDFAREPWNTRDREEERSAGLALARGLQSTSVFLSMRATAGL